ncbi:MAG UNVERIFIED_CONTAM: hypothetical protein LVR18_33465 [Planctomycetaceae bacterium]
MKRFRCLDIGDNHSVIATLQHALQLVRRGTEEKTGSQNLAVIMSITEICRRVCRRPFDDITDSVMAAFNAKSAPTLLP